MKRVKVTRGQGQRSGSKVKVTINVKEKAGGLTPTSSCFMFSCRRCFLISITEILPIGKKKLPHVAMLEEK